MRRLIHIEILKAPPEEEAYLLLPQPCTDWYQRFAGLETSRFTEFKHLQAINPGLNPAGGRRLPMSRGRGLEFDTPHGLATISHFSEPVWVSVSKDPAQACVQKSKVRIQLTEYPADLSNAELAKGGLEKP